VVKNQEEEKKKAEEVSWSGLIDGFRLNLWAPQGPDKCMRVRPDLRCCGVQ
jgi:hypothetical protein